MAAIFIRNVPDRVTDVILTRDLARILHGHPFHDPHSAQRINFHVSLHRERGSGARGHRGIGTITLPNLKLAKAFLAVYGRPRRPPLPYDNWGMPDLLVFEHHRDAPRDSTLKLIQETPYVDPQVLHDKEEKDAQLQGFIYLSAVQLGKRCRDGRFSIEWDAKDLDPQPTGIPSLEFLPDSREIWISLSSPPEDYSDSVEYSEDGHSQPMDPEPAPRIGFRWSKVEKLEIESSGAAIFNLRHSPAYEVQLGSRRRPCSYFDSAHQQAVAFASKGIRIAFRYTDGLNILQDMAAVAGLPVLRTVSLGSVKRRLFSGPAIEWVKLWISQLDWPIAFQVDGLLSSLAIDPTELCLLRREIEDIAVEFGVARTCEVLRLFRGRLTTLNDKGKDERGARTIQDCLFNSKNDITPHHMTLQNQAWNDGVFECLHVTVTPTRSIPSGPYPDQVRDMASLVLPPLLNLCLYSVVQQDSLNLPTSP